ncbi:MAG TPA: GNAT family N-acetyltransferase [Stellaceae bacterium]|nr:GNAT family N-acetyltransferase [Stellaceae bacterium]
MPVTLRPPRPDDAAACGDILYRAFKTLADRHNFPPDFPSAAVGQGVMAMLIGHPGAYGLVAEEDGRVLGSNFADKRASIIGIGPISVDPETQNRGVGRALMQATVDHFTAQRVAGIRLLQAAYHNRSLCLYTSIGFRARDPVSVINGPPLGIRFPGYDVRRAVAADLAACNALARRLHGFDRGAELRDAIAAGTAMVVEHLGEISGYATEIGFLGHAVAAANRDLMALIGAAAGFAGPGFLLPTRNHEVFAWCLEHKLRLVMQMTLMTMGLYSEPLGAWMPSVLY